MRRITWMMALSLLLFDMAIAQNTIDEHKSSKVERMNLEMPKITVHPIRDTEKNREYDLYIKLPEGYSQNDSIQYPVLYTTDAMWHIEILSGATEFILEDVILVGISWEKGLKGELGALGAHASRFRDYSIQPSSNAQAQAKYGLGQASNHLAFIRNEIFSYVEKNYRTDPTQRSYFGYSLGGLFGAYILLSQPDSFKNYILGSPALEGDINYLSQLESNQRTNVNVFISLGNLEEKLTEDVDRVIEIFKTKKHRQINVTRKVVEGNHQTAFPLTGVESVIWLAGLARE